jgi:hypothetical protein
MGEPPFASLRKMQGKRPVSPLRVKAIENPALIDGLNFVLPEDSYGQEIKTGPGLLG